MKGLQFLGNRVEDAANAFIDVLKYSDQSVEYPDFKDIEPWPDEIINLFYVIWKNATFSELSAIIMYTQQSSRFDEISELMLGIGLVEMRHLDKISDFLQKADPYEDYSTMSINPNNWDWFYLERGNEDCFKFRNGNHSSLSKDSESYPTV